MVRIAQTRSRVLPISLLLLSPLFPTVASAGWGDENWGEMVWGSFAGVDIPALPAAGFAILVVVLFGASYWLLAVQRMRANRPR
jgi:hypothetical protein